jgi:copper chaperone CopZ
MVRETSCKQIAHGKGKTMETATLYISGMSNLGSVRSVRGALEAINGVDGVVADAQRRFVTLRFDPGRAKPAQLRTAVRVVGCRVTSIILAGDAEQEVRPTLEPTPEPLHALR